MKRPAIRTALKSKGWTQRQLAEKVGCSEPLVSHWINGTVEPTLKFALRLGAVLDVPVEELLRTEAA